MSRYDGPEEPADRLDVGDRPDAECADCGLPFHRGSYAMAWCEGCSNRRDHWASVEEIKTMAKAVLQVDLSTVKDIA